MRKLHIKSENKKDFFDNLKDLTVTRSLSNLAVDKNDFVGIFPNLNGILKKDSLIIEGYYEYENMRGIVFNGTNRKFLILDGDVLKVIQVSGTSTHFHFLDLLELISESPVSVNFLDT